MQIFIILAAVLLLSGLCVLLKFRKARKNRRIHEEKTRRMKELDAAISNKSKSNV